MSFLTNLSDIRLPLRPAKAVMASSGCRHVHSVTASLQQSTDMDAGWIGRRGRGVSTPLGIARPSLLALACLAFFVSSSLLYLRSASSCFCPGHVSPLAPYAFRGDLRLLPVSWNVLSFSSSPPPICLRVALFVKKWPFSTSAGGLERHALTLHRHLADRCHQVHVFTSDTAVLTSQHFEELGVHLHLSSPNANGNFDFAAAWENFVELNASHTFDIIHTESVALPAHKASTLVNVVVSWHGIGYEAIHSDIVSDLNRQPGEARSRVLAERLYRVVDEVKFFPSYTHHVATSDYVGDVLRTVYEISPEKVHIILNGVSNHQFRFDPRSGSIFRVRFGVPMDARLVFGAGGRLVKDKGYPVLFEAFSQVMKEYEDVYLLIAGDGPWAGRFKDLAPNVIVLGPLGGSQLAGFYNAIDVFVNPTQRAQGLDHTLLEAMLCGKPLLATHFSSITRSVIVNEGVGYTFSSNVPSLLNALRLVIRESKEALESKGRTCLQRASLLFTATKMGSAYERLFLCIKDKSLCKYPWKADGDNGNLGV